jgi:hypothetical protein
MYQGLKLRVGRTPGNADAASGTKSDPFRLDDGTPILGDKRNDENKIVSQFHGVMIQLHNKVVDNDALLGAFGGDISTDTARFRTAATIVRWHYQWAVVFDYLDRICEPWDGNRGVQPWRHTAVAALPEGQGALCLHAHRVLWCGVPLRALNGAAELCA